MAKFGPREVHTLQQVLPNTEDFFKSADTVWKSSVQGTLSVAGRALQKHAGRSRSAFSSIKFSGKTANQDAIQIIKEIIASKSQVIKKHPQGGYHIFGKVTGRGIAVSRKGTFNGFRNN